MLKTAPPVFLLHGRESSPQSAKMRALNDVCRAMNLESSTPDFSGTQDPEERVRMLAAQLPHDRRPLILAGSSMGGYVAARVSQQYPLAGLFLIAPAFYLPRYPTLDLAPKAKSISIVHGWSDEIVPVENSIRYARQHQAELHLISGDHRLEAELEQVCSLFKLFLQKQMSACSWENLPDAGSNE